MASNGIHLYNIARTNSIFIIIGSKSSKIRVILIVFLTFIKKCYGKMISTATYFTVDSGAFWCILYCVDSVAENH